MNSSLGAPVEHVYAHVPFCAKKCEYCAFYSGAADNSLISWYVDSLIKEMERCQAALRPRTVFFGGGTPSLLSRDQWRRVLTAMERLGLLGAEEFTVECNPATISYDKARLLCDFGVNRVSMGAQSFDPGLLETLGRTHSRETIFRSFATLRSAGFDNINIDLMFALPGQSMDQWRATMKQAFSMGSEHVACYEVIYEEDTPLFNRLQAGEFAVDEDLVCAMYEELIDAAAAAGFEQYEIANFAKGGQGEGVPRYACQHNISYWRGKDFVGFGPSASGYLNGVRLQNWSNTRRYCQDLDQGRSVVESSEALPPLARAGEIAAFGLRMPIGWTYSEFLALTGFDLREEWDADMDRLVKEGHGRRTEGGFCLTGQGLRFADHAAEYFLR